MVHKTRQTTPGDRPQMPNKVVIDQGNEQAILSTVIAHPKECEKYIRTYTSNDFLIDKHRDLWTVFRACVNKGYWYDSAYAHMLFTERRSEDLKAGAYLSSLEAVKPALDDEKLKQRFDRLRWNNVKQKLVTEHIPELMTLSCSNESEPSKIQASCFKIQQSLKHNRSNYIVTPDQVVNSYSSELHRRADRKHAIFGLGLKEFDQHIGIGFAPGYTSVVAGVTSSGKSSLMMNWALALADQGHRVVYCAWEEPITSLNDTMAAIKLHEKGITYTKLQTGQLDDKERRQALAAVKIYTVDGVGPNGTGQIIFVANPFVDLYALSDRKRRTNIDNLMIIAGILAETHPNVIFYDMWERCLLDRRIDEVELALQYTQQLHKDFDCHGVIGAQVNIKKVESRSEKDPNRADIKGTAKLVEVADMVWLVHRPGQYIAKKDMDNIMETVKSKDRNGPSPIKIIWDWVGQHKLVRNPRIHFDEDDIDFDNVNDHISFGSEEFEIG
jgi:replicative DNA helicase